MTRHARTSLAAAAVACALAVIAPVASAHQFTGSESGEVRVTASEAQEFSFKPFKITCETAKSVKTGNVVTFPSSTLYLELRYSKCTTAGGKLHKIELPPVRARFTAPVDLEYHANGFVETGAGSESSTEITNAGAVEIALKGAFKCIVSWEPQTVPEKAVKKPTGEYDSATFETEEVPTENLKRFPTGIQDKLLIHNELKKMSFSLSEGICEEFETTEGKSGSYTGTLLAELKKASLSWE